MTEDLVAGFRDLLGNDTSEENWTIFSCPEEDKFRLTYIPAGHSKNFYVNAAKGKVALSGYVLQHGRLVKQRHQVVTELQDFLGNDMRQGNWILVIRPAEDKFRVLYISARQAKKFYVDMRQSTVALRPYLLRYGRLVTHRHDVVQYVDKRLRERVKFQSDPSFRKGADAIYREVSNQIGKLSKWLEEPPEGALKKDAQ